MKTLLVVIDGLGDEPIPALGGNTPFSYASHKNIDYLAQHGQSGKVSICENDFSPDSLGCTLRLLGVEQKDFPRNRAYLELLANERDISEYEMVLRCNLVSVDAEGRLLSFNAQGLTQEEMHEASLIADEFHSNIEFIHLSYYRNLLIMDKKQELLTDCEVKPPHESVGENIDDLLSEVCRKSLLLKNFIAETRKLLSKFARDGVEYMFYPWGPSERTAMKSFEERHRMKGAVVCAAEIIKGIALALSMTRPELLKATADVDTDICEKADTALRMLKDNDFVFVHFNGSDEVSHRYDYLGKADFIAKIDKEFFGKLLSPTIGPLKVLVCGDHVTSSISGRHTADKVPFVAGLINKNNEEVCSIKTYRDFTKFLFEGRS